MYKNNLQREQRFNPEGRKSGLLYTDGQQTDEIKFIITYHQRNESQITMKYHLTTVRMALIKSKNTQKEKQSNKC